MQLKDTILTVYLLNIYWLVNIKLNRIETEYINLNFEVFFFPWSLNHAMGKIEDRWTTDISRITLSENLLIK